MRMPAAADKAWAGIDVGKRHHWVCVVDSDGRQLLSQKVANDQAEIAAVIGAVTGLAPAVTWAVDIIGAPSALVALPAQPAEQALVVHQFLLAEAARHVQHVKLRSLVDHRVGCEEKALHVADGLVGETVDPVCGVRDASEHLEWPGQVDLVQPVEQEGPDMKVNVGGD
jgi:Transposase